VTTTSCTQAILMALAWHLRGSGFVPMEPATVRRMPKLSLRRRAGSDSQRRDARRSATRTGKASTELDPLPVWDSARRFTSGMYRPGAMQCVSFHATKILADSQGGAILHDDPEADAWLRRARFDGRTEGVDPKDDQVQYPSWHAYLSPDVAARLLWKLQGLPRHNPDLPRSDYPDLSKMEAFR
jgi:hypothetical protein